MQQLLFIGLGRIGLPQSLVFAKKGFIVYAHDHDRTVTEKLNMKQTPFYEPMLNEYLATCLNDTFFPTHSWDDIVKILSEIDAIFFTLGTSAPDSKSCLTDEELDLNTIETVLGKIFNEAASLKHDIKLIFRTTLPLGSIDRLKQHIETTYGKIEGRDFHIAFVPERLMEGNAISEEETLPKIIGTYNETAFAQIKQIFEKIGGAIIKASSPTTAEFCKLTDNSFRNTLFSFSNEIAMLANEVGVDIIEVLEAINKDYQRNKIQRPGFVSGYCLGKDPYIFEYGFHNSLPNRKTPSVWYQGRQTNDYLVDYVAHKIATNVQGIEDPCVTILGLSFKENIDDFRMSHSIALINKLIALGIKRFHVFDPNVNKNKYTQLPDDLIPHIELQSPYLSEDLFTGIDAILIAHRHDEIVMANKRITLQRLFSNRKGSVYIFDAWNVWRETIGFPGLRYEALGYKAYSSGTIESIKSSYEVLDYGVNR